jgi:hypothetical protein
MLIPVEEDGLRKAYGEQYVSYQRIRSYLEQSYKLGKEFAQP